MLKLLWVDLKMTFRNRQSLFWSFMFPLMFTFIFGFFFGKNTTSGTVDLINNSNSQIAVNFEKALNDSGLFKINAASDETAIKEDIRKTRASAGVVVPENFGSPKPESPTQIKIIYDPGNSQVNSILMGFTNNFLTTANFQMQNAKPIFSIDEDKTSNRTLTYFDFVLVGLLGMALMNSSVNSISISMSKYREDKILKRITTTPLKSWHFITAEVLSRLVINFLQVGVILAIGKYLFDAHIYGNLAIIFIVSMVGAILFQLLGFMVAAFSKTTDAAQGMATAITIPMMFLAGVFFPIDSLPRWLYSIVQYLPLAPLLRIIRGVALEALSPFDNPMNVVLVVGWVVVLLALSAWRFRLSEE